MIRVLVSAGLLGVLPLLCPGQLIALSLKVQPMAAPKPALKYHLLPDVGELKPGNPAQWYVRCFAEQQNFFFHKESVAQRNRYLTRPLAELRKEKANNYGGNALRQADWGARLDALDWQVLERVQSEGLDLAQPEMEALQILGQALGARFRLEVAGRHHDDAIRTAQTMFALARHLGEFPTLEANRVGLSIANLALAILEEMVQQPDCPNLYWALTDLPSPLVDARKGLQGERARVAAEMRPLRADVPMTEEELEKAVSRLSGLLGMPRERAGWVLHSLRARLKTRTADSEQVRAARGRLVAAGGKKETIEKLLSVQVILLDEKLAFETRWDEGRKLLSLAPWQVDALPGGAASITGGGGLFSDFLPDFLRLHRAQGRLEQRIALLRHVEALRLYAAEHEGKLPAALSDVPVPLPADSFSGKPFRYQVDGGTAQLCGCPPRGEEQNPSFKRRHEVTIRN
jgi:hypothetical protein